MSRVRVLASFHRQPQKELVVVAESMICTQCGTVASPKRFVPGSIIITLILLLFYVIPGLIYEIWRRSSTYDVCQKCGSRNLVPPASPFGRDIVTTRPSVAASLAVENQGQKDMMVGAAILGGIVLFIFLIMWLRL
jgi:hypothetical protein